MKKNSFFLREFVSQKFLKNLILVQLFISFAVLNANSNNKLSNSDIEEKKYDFVVVGATPGGISCAVRAAREGLKVLLVERTSHIGGFISSGGGGWEAPYDGIRSPIYSEIRNRITEYYRKKYGEGSSQHLSSIPNPEGNRHIDRAKVEPHVAEIIFNRLVKAEKNLTLVTGYIPIEVNRTDNKILSLKLKEFEGESFVTIQGSIFSDCTYEGDLAALSQVLYKVGREPRNEYDEPHAGVVFTKNYVETGSTKRFSTDAVEGRLNIRTFPGLMCKEEVLPESTGDGDSIVMAYNYRMILTSDSNNQVSINKPKGYDPSQFIGFDGGRVVPDIPNQKVAYNAGRLVGPQAGYPEGNWATRDSISKLYLNYILQQLYYLKNDAPKEIRQRWDKFSLAKDEFVDNENIPYEIYVREARRIIGRYIFTEHDNIPDVIERSRIHQDAIAITDWPVDLVASTSRKVPDGNMDGIVFLAESSRPAQVPYRCILPKGVDNLLVPVCLSSSHVGWGPIRLEPVWIQIGEAAGFAAALSKKLQTTPGKLNSDVLVCKLIESGAEVTLFNDVEDNIKTSFSQAIQYFGTKGFFRGYNSHPNQNLDKETASIWVEIFEKLFKNEVYDATAQAACLPKNLAPNFSSVSVSNFVYGLKTVYKLPSTNIDDILEANFPYLSGDSKISRAESCLIMYILLKEKAGFEK